MSISVSGKSGFEVGDSLNSFVRQELDRIIEKYIGEIINASVVFSKSGNLHHLFVVDMTINLSNHISVHFQGENSDPYRCVSYVIHKLEKQIAKYKNRLRSKKRPHHGEDKASVLVSKYIIDPMQELEEDEENIEGDNPAIIAQMEIPLVKMSVADAAMKLDLARDPVLVFINSKNGKVNVVYKREDNNIGWIDPSNNDSSQ